MFIAIQRYCDAEDPFWSNCKILGVFKTESSAKSACDAAYDEILKYDFMKIRKKVYSDEEK